METGFDITQFLTVTKDTAAIVIVAVMGLTTLAGEFGVRGKWQMLTSLLLGLVFGGGYLVALAGAPTSFAGWFLVVLAGLTMGLVTSGLYNTGKKWAAAAKPPAPMG